jgi:CRISPR-associated protein Cmr2
MNHDYFAAHSYLDSYDHVQRRVVDYLVGGKEPLEEFAHLSAIKDPAAKVEMLALAQLSIKNYATSGDPREKSGGLKSALPSLNRSFEQRVDNDLMRLGLMPVLPALDELPELSFAIHFRFKLRQPYLSHDESVHYLLDNPVRKEKVFRLPYVAPSQWKGTLHAVMTSQLAAQWEGNIKNDEDLKAFLRQRARLFALFGTEKAFELGEESEKKSPGKKKKRAETLYLDKLMPVEKREWNAQMYRRYIRRYLTGNGFIAGRLQFYPSFFTQLGLEVMNPHSRKTGAGEVPILFETVPKGAEAGFTVLYIPHDCVGRQNDPQVRARVAEDLQRLACGLQEMFCLYGFGAKVTSGFGRAEDKIEGKLALRAHGLPSLETGKSASQKSEAVALPKYLEAPDRLKPEYLNPDGTFRERSEAELKQMGKMSRWEYDKARRWWQTQSQKAQPAEPESKPAKPALPEVSFKSFAELEQKAKRMADALQEGDAK